MKKNCLCGCLARGGNCRITKTLLVMKLTLVFLLAGFLSVSAEGFTQDITFSGKNVPLTKVLSSIEKQSNVVFIYTDYVLKKSKPVSIQASKVPLVEFLSAVFKDQPLDFEISGNNIFVSLLPVTATAVPEIPKEPEVLADTLVEIKGRVTDDKGEPLEGVTVGVKFSKKTVLTDASGVYRIGLTSKERVLVFSFIGFQTQDRNVGANTTINVLLSKQVQSMDQVVVVGYGKQKKRDLTGSVGSIKSEEISRTKVPTFQEAIQGKVAGVQISSASGEPGAAANISIRGANSIYASSNPLYVIDGVQYDANSSEMVTANIGNKTVSNPLSSLNPNDIESIDILKDASATAIYGSRGANGVIIITTKTGRAGAAKVVYDGFAGVSTPMNRLNILSANEYLDYQRNLQPYSALFYYDTNKDNIFDDRDTPRDTDSLPKHDYQKEILKPAFTQSHNLSVSGGSGGTNYSASLGYFDQDAIVRNNNMNRFTFRSNLNQDIGKKIKLGLYYSMSNTVFNGPSHSGGGAGLFNGVVQNIIISRPVEFYDPNWDRTALYYPPLSMIDQAYKSMSTVQNMVNGNINYQIARGLSFNVSGGVFWTDSKGKEFYGKTTDWGVIDKGLGTLQQSKSKYIINTNQLNYEKSFGANHRLNLMAAMEVNQYDFEYFNVSKSNFANEETGIDDINKGSIAKGSASSRDISRRLSYFGRANYTFLNRHLFTATFRADGSDKFGKGQRFGYFPSFAYAWIASDENFLKESKIISNLKFRASYGVTGNERIPSFRYLPRLSNAFYEAMLGFAPTSRENPNLQWETTTQYNLGFDLGLFKNRVNLTFDVYNKQTDDMLIEAFVPARTGYSTQWMNIGKMSNKGIEVLLSTKNIDKKDIGWETNITFSSNRNKVLDIGNVSFIPVIVGGSWIENVGRVTVGQQIGTGYGYKFDGIYQIDDFTWDNNSDPSIPHNQRNYVLKDDVVSLTGINVKPGFHKFKDLNGDGAVDLDNDRTTISRSAPKFFGGFNNTFRYKNFDLNIFFEGSYGAQVMNVSRFQLEAAYPTAWMNISKDFYDNKWTPENPSNTYGDYNVINTNSRLVSDYFVEDASYLRLKNLSVGYSFAPGVINKLRVQNLRVYVSGSNLMTWTNYTGFDPEVQSGEPLMQGLDRISYPRARVFNFGINATF